MGAFERGDVVLLPFPFSDLSQQKLRPALVVATVSGVGNLILCQITSQFVWDAAAISLTDDDFVSGGLRQISNVRPNVLFTAHESLILRRVGTLSTDRLNVVLEAVAAQFSP